MLTTSPLLVYLCKGYLHINGALSKAIFTSTGLDLSSSNHVTDTTFRISFGPSHFEMGEMELNNKTNLPVMFDWDSIDSTRDWEGQKPSLTFRTSLMFVPSCLVCHCDIDVKARGHVKNKVDTIQKMIDGYMNFYRNNASKNVFPKLHFLEHYCTQWISRWGFGMGLHGEQGVELHKEAREPSPRHKTSRG